MSRFRDGVTFYEREYHRLVVDAKRDHVTLLDVFECDDRTYCLGSDEQLQALNLAGYSRITFPLSDNLDFQQDPSLSSNDILGDAQELFDGQVTGFTSVVENAGHRRTIVVMRKGTGQKPTVDNVKCEIRALKVAALAHEIGHVDDIEKGINWKENIRNMVGSEVYAHHYACRTMMERSCFFALGLYVDGVAKMMKARSEYVRIAAEHVVKSTEFKQYRAVLRKQKDKW